MDFLLAYLQESCKHLKVHVDYSDDIISNVSEEFLRENNVRFLVQLLDISQESSVKAQLSHSSTLGAINGNSHASQQDSTVVGPEEESKTFSPPQPS